MTKDIKKDENSKYLSIKEVLPAPNSPESNKISPPFNLAASFFPYSKVSCGEFSVGIDLAKSRRVPPFETRRCKYYACF